MNHTPTPYIVKKSHAAPEIVGVNTEPTPTSKALIRRVAIVLLEGGSEGMEEAIANAEFIVEACNAHEGLKKENEDLHRTLGIITEERDGLLRAAVATARKTIALCEGKETS